MKDGEVWVVEYKSFTRWRFMVAYNNKKFAEENCKSYTKHGSFSYRVVKYVRLEAELKRLK